MTHGKYTALSRAESASINYILTQLFIYKSRLEAGNPIYGACGEHGFVFALHTLANLPLENIPLEQPRVVTYRQGKMNHSLVFMTTVYITDEARKNPDTDETTIVCDPYSGRFFFLADVGYTYAVEELSAFICTVKRKPGYDFDTVAELPFVIQDAEALTHLQAVVQRDFPDIPGIDKLFTAPDMTPVNSPSNR